MNFSEPFHVTNGVRQGVVLSPYLFAVYLDGLSLKLKNIKAGCYIGKFLLNHLMFADDLCVLSKCTWVAKYIRYLAKCAQI